MSEKYEIVIIDNGKNQVYKMSEAPESKSNIVKQYKKILTAELDIGRLLTNLDYTASLIYIAYNALSGTSAQSKVSGLQQQLSLLCAKSQTAMADIGSKTAEILEQIPTVYNLLVEGEAELAIELLNGCTEAATGMAKVSEELALGFDNMCEKAQLAMEQSQDIYAQDIEKRNRIMEEIKTIRAKSKGLAEQSKILTEDLAEIKSSLTKAEESEAKAEKTAMIMGIVGLCTSTLTLGIGDLIKNAGAKKEENSEELTKSQEEAKKAGEEAKKSINELKKENEVLEKLLEKQKETPEDEEIKVKIAEQQKIIENKKASKETKEKAVKVAQSALKALNEGIEKAQNAIDGNLKKAQSKTEELMKQKLKMQEENRAIAKEMASLAEGLKNQTENKISADTAIQMLQLAIRCLGNIVATFTEMALFWRNIERGFNNLESAGFIKQLKVFQKLPIEKQQEKCTEEGFKMQILIYMATWAALNNISRDYYQISENIGKKVRNNIKKNLFEKEAYQEAKKLADEILSKMELTESEITANENQIKQTIKQISE